MTNVTARDILVEFDDLVTEAMIAWFTKEDAEQRVRKYQKEKYWEVDNSFQNKDNILA